MPLTNLDVLKLTIDKTTGTTQHLVDAIVETFGFDLGNKPFISRPFIQRVRTRTRTRVTKEVESLELPIIKKVG